LDRLSEAAAAAVVEFLLGDFVREPRRVGKPLRAELSGTWSARRGPYQIVYTVSENDRSENDRTVAVLRIEHRADVYRQR
jgi:mRNA-degrading endonuclease RelE of RelBE toxin-antitoxin system